MLDPRAILAKGFALVKRQDGQMVKSALEIKTLEPLIIRFHDGKVEATTH